MMMSHMDYSIESIELGLLYIWLFALHVCRSTCTVLYFTAAVSRNHSTDSNASLGHFHRPHPLHIDPDFDTSRRSSTFSIDFLTLPQSSLAPPLSPGAHSVASNWSELIRLADRRDSDDSILSYHSPPHGRQ